jgi:hypothetical protein
MLARPGTRCGAGRYLYGYPYNVKILRMSIRSLTVPLTGFGCAPTEAQVTVETLSVRARLARGAAVAGAGLALAVIALPIPLVHFVLVPTALLLGITFGTIRLGQREIFSSAEGACPFCGTRQRLGLAGRVFRLPRRVFCSNCQRELDLGRDVRVSSPAD